MESVLNKGKLVILSTGQYWLIFNGEKGMSDREGHGHNAVVYKSHFLPLTSVVTETPTDTLANKPRLHQRLKSLFFMPPRQKASVTFLMSYVKVRKAFFYFSNLPCKSLSAPFHCEMQSTITHKAGVQKLGKSFSEFLDSPLNATGHNTLIRA